MDVVVANTTGGDRTLHWSALCAAEVAAALAAAGARVRWLCAVPEGCVAPEVDGVAVQTAVESVAPFRKVSARVESCAVEMALAQAMRERPASHAVVLGAGAPGSCLTSWVADRMGAEVLMGVRAREALCHRQDLHSEDPDGPRGPCATWDDPWRCVRCCRQLSGRWGQAVAGLAGVLGGVSPFPNPLGFANRLENVISGLLPASTVLVAEGAERDQLVAAGIPARRLEVADPHSWPARFVERIRGGAPAVGSV